MKYLIGQYKDSLHKVQRLKHRLSEERTSRTYRERIDKETKQVKRVVTSVEKQPVTDPETILTGIVDSLTYSIEWLEHNREPGLRRGADKAPKHRIVLMDPQSDLFIKLAVQRQQLESKVSEEDKARLEDVLAILTSHEREAFMLVRGRSLSYEKAAELLEVSKSTVQTLVDRAEEKIEEAIELNEVQRVMFTEVI